ncbi:MAG TPA: hypothetical protein VGR11_12660 [Solirubrobacteraceae bacterium]|nr:hypothetical protein [Solirubrobacteraceae bacterium]
MSSEICACGLQAQAMATGTTKAATSIVAKVTWRLRPAPVRPDFGNTALSFVEDPEYRLDDDRRERTRT